MKTSMKKILSGLLCFCMMMALVPAALAEAEDGLCPHHTAHSAEICGFDDTAGTGCAYVCELCSALPAPEEEPVDFMQYLEDPILVAFQMAEDIDLHDWLVNAYGLPAEIPFTCSPATVPFGMYEDGSLVPVTVTAGDALSGVASTEYLEAASGLDMTALAAAQWTEYTGAIPVTLEDAKRFVYYAKITDAAGNVSYLSTDGTTYDTTAPSIAGVTEGETCYITKSVTVSDANLQTVTLKTGTGTPQEMTASFDLPGNVDTVCTITAKDKAGNVTTVTVTMKPVGALDDALDTGGEAMTADNVSLADEPAITAIRDQAESLMDKTDVPAEDAALQDIVDRMDTLLDAIEEAKGVIELIDALPDTAQPDSEEHIAAWQAAQDAFDDKCYDDAGELNNIGAMVGPEKKAALDAFGEALRDYRIIAGNGASWTKGSGAGLSLTANGLFAKFTGIEVDGVAVDAANYTAESGSTILCLQKAYLNSLSTGEHSIRILYTDGEASGSFRIQAAPTVPSTGDHSHVELWIGALCLCALGFAAVLAAARRRRSDK